MAELGGEGGGSTETLSSCIPRWKYCQFFCELDLAIAGSEGRRRDINRACYFPVIPSSVKSVEVGRVIGPDSYV